MRKLVAAATAVTAMVLGVLAPVAAQALPGGARQPAVMSADLRDRLASDTTGRLVVFVSGRTLEDAERAVDAAGLRSVDTFDRIGVVVAVGTSAQVRTVAGRPGVSHVELDRKMDLSLGTSLKATRGEDVNKGFTVDGHAVPPITGAGVSIAVIDSGIDGTHPFFKLPDGSSKVVQNLKFACPFFYACDGSPPADPPDSNDALWLPVPSNDSDTGSMGGHGTHVAGIAAGRAGRIDGTRRITGSAPGAKLVALSVGQTLSVYAGYAGMNWVVEHHADPCGRHDLVACPPIRVINNSWGAEGGPYEFVPDGVEARLQRLLVAEGVTVVWAAGNDGGDGTEDHTSADAKDPTPGVLSVANYDDKDTGTRDGTLDPSSSRGLRGDPRTYPDISAPGATITSSCRRTLPVCYLNGDPGDTTGNYFNLGGTSMAAPHIAGIVAQLVQATKGSITPAQVEDLLEDTARKFTDGGSYEKDPRNPDNTTSFDKGHGLVDVKAAVAALRRRGRCCTSP